MKIANIFSVFIGVGFSLAGFSQAIQTHALGTKAPPRFESLDCSDQGNLPQQQMNECERLKWIEADKALQTTYDNLLSKLKADQKLVERTQLIASERRWVKQKENACAKKNMESGGGTLGVLEVYSCQLEWTLKRTEFLRTSKF